LLEQALADMIDLAMRAKQAHWNVRGPNFVGLHDLFDSVASKANEHADGLAERAVQLGSAPDGTLKGVASRSRLGEYPRGTVAWSQHVAEMTSALLTLGTSIRKAIDAAAAAGDAGTADLLTEISRDLDKLLWMVSVHAA
jgi:starvation-inducible DNA-binding protein